MQHRVAYRLAHAQPELLPTTDARKTRALVNLRSVQRATAVLAVLVVLSLGYTYHWHHQVYRNRNLSSCPARLAAAGLSFNSVPTDAFKFVTSSKGLDDAFNIHAIRRRELYDDMAKDLRQQGLRLGGVITQGLTQADLFALVPVKGRWSKAHIKPKLRRLQTPVRAVVLPLLQHEAALQLHTAVRHALQQLLADESIWYQDPTLMHATIYHASDYKDPVPADQQQVAAEAAAVAGVASRTCPVQAVLDRLVITSTGMVVACWQVLPRSGDPASLRLQLKDALLHAPPPEQQVVQDIAIFHITVARLLAPALHAVPNHAAVSNSGAGQVWTAKHLQQALQEIMEDLSAELCGLIAEFDELWYVEEQDLLALGLGGSHVKHASALHCPL